MSRLEGRGAAGVKLEAHAKVNLTLEILGKRNDGYHNLVSVMQTIDLHDEVGLEACLEPSGEITLECDEPGLSGRGNLALMAAEALREVSGVSAGARISLRKKIPVAAGLGGGSSDAAAVLLGLNRVWDAGLDPRQLSSLALTLGSDVPYFLHGGTALVQGRGEDVTPLPDANVGWLVLLTPDIQLEDKTGTLFSRLSPGSHTRGVLSHKLAGRIRGAGDVPPQFLFNAFDEAAESAFPGLVDYRAAFRGIGASEVTLSGAGPTLYALPGSRELGVAWQLLLQNRGWNATLARAWWPGKDCGPDTDGE